MKKKFLCCICAMILLTCTCLSAFADKGTSSIEYIQRIVVSYAVYGKRDTKALRELSEADPALGEKWERIMDLWTAPVTVNPELPDGLPEDDSLCLVVQGFQLDPDGTIREELEDRLQVTLAASKKYPQAWIVCSGGGTAANHPEVTEAGRMAEWLEANGVDPARIIQEDRSMTTAQNAIYTLDLLTGQYPQVREIAIISSDYHIPSGLLLFGTVVILQDSPVSMVSNAACQAPNGSHSVLVQVYELLAITVELGEGV